MKPERRVDLFALLDPLSTQLGRSVEVDKALRFTLRATKEFFEASSACVAVLRPGPSLAEMKFALPDGAGCDLSLLTAFIREKHPAIPHDLIVGPVRRRGRAWAALALARPGRPFERGTGSILCRATQILSDALERIDRDRMLEVRARIDRKIMEEIRPKDLFYQILDGLRSLTRYDHSSALLIRVDGDGAIGLEAEQIAWMKGKSRRIGLVLPLSEEVRGILDAGEVCGFDRDGDTWREWSGRPMAELARLLDYNRDADVREASMICAPLPTREGVLGVMKVAARHAGTFARHEAALVEGFRTQAAVAILNSRRAETLEARIIEAERRSAMADLARGVSHDVNNAVGSVLPLVQQIREELAAGKVDPQVLVRDLAQIEESLRLCRRIFGGMLALARGGARKHAHGQVHMAAESTLAILKDTFARRGVSVEVNVPDGLPGVAGGQSDLDQVFLNLLTNARDATPAGGRVSVRAGAADGNVEIVIEDTGSGISREDLARVWEPFYTTKPEGSGLGLAICRSIVWQIGGSLAIESEPGKGTKVLLVLPQAPSSAQEAPP